MRLSVWQQFSSNNSSNFVLVGQFETPEAASGAYRIVSSVLMQIADYYHNLPTRVRSEDVVEPSQVEINSFGVYGIEIKRALDWLVGEKPEDIDRYITLLDNSVIVADPNLPNSAGEKPFDDLIAKLGGKVYVRNGRAKSGFQFRLTCAAPDLETTDEIYKALTGNENAPIPWLNYYGGKKAHDIDALWQNYETFLKYQPLRTMQLDIETRIKVFERNADEHIEKLKVLNDRLAQIERKLHELETKTPPLSDPERFRIIHMRDQLQLHNPIVTRQDSAIIVEAYLVGNTYEGMVVGLPALVAWLRARGCTVGVDFMREEKGKT